MVRCGEVGYAASPTYSCLPVERDAARTSQKIVPHTNSHVVTHNSLAVANEFARPHLAVSPTGETSSASDMYRKTVLKHCFSTLSSSCKFLPSQKFQPDHSARSRKLARHRLRFGQKHKNLAKAMCFVSFVRPVGIEPTTVSLKGSCSTD
jgi:hypothetical protein